ncbi:MAG: LTA synthase family protein [Oscillospiraceae bacterium]
MNVASKSEPREKKKWHYPRIRTSERTGLWLSRAFWLLGPLVGFLLVEMLNNNNPFLDFSYLQIALNLAIYYSIAGLVFLIVGRRNLSCGISTTLFWLIGVANHYVLFFSGRTIFPSDFLTLNTAANVAENYSYAFDQLQYISLALIFAFLIVLSILPKQQGRSKLRLRSALPAAILGVGFFVVFFFTGFLSWVDIQPSMWTTTGNGFLLNFSVCLRYSRAEKPAGYSVDELNNIINELPPETKPVDGIAAGTKPENLIVIMNESFSDLGETWDLPVSGDSLPFWRSLRENTIRGNVYASVFGGTTANSEYEFLTGNSTAFMPTGAVPFQLYVKEGSESLVAQMNNLGYNTIAMHPYLPSGWNRPTVYKDFGFNRALFQKQFENKTLIRNYISDQTSFENLVRIYEEKKPGEQLFLFNVTMQNHGGYKTPWDEFEEPIKLEGKFAGRFPTVDQYLSLIKESDKAFEYLINYFAQVEEPTMILMFGDHQPQVATNFYTELLGEKPDLKALQNKYKIPFVIWANYDIPEQEGIDTSLNYLSSMLMDAANLPKTDYQSFLLQLQRTVPAMNANGYRGTDGVWHAKTSELSDEEKAKLGEYEKLQYNELFEKRENRLEDVFFLPKK